MRVDCCSPRCTGAYMPPTQQPTLGELDPSSKQVQSTQIIYDPASGLCVQWINYDGGWPSEPGAYVPCPPGVGPNITPSALAPPPAPSASSLVPAVTTIATGTKQPTGAPPASSSSPTRQGGQATGPAPGDVIAGPDYTTGGGPAPGAGASSSTPAGAGGALVPLLALAALVFAGGGG